MNSLTASRFSQTRSELAEGPLWSEKHDGLFWVDILGRKIHFQSMSLEKMTWVMPKMPSALALTDDGRLVVGHESEVVLFNPKTHAIEVITDIDRDRPGNRTNDGGCDPCGNFWIGTMSHSTSAATGRLWCVHPDGNKKVILEDVGIPNTLAWDTKNNWFYFADSMKHEMYRFRYTPEDPSRLSERETFIYNPANTWTPDGSAIDSSGNIWNAQWEASRVACYTPQRQLSATIEIPTSCPTSCTFGGSDYATLFITSAIIHNENEKHGGFVYAARTRSRGAPANIFHTRREKQNLFL